MNIHDELKKYKISLYDILGDGSIHAHQNVYLSGKNLIKIPFNFYKIDGLLDISNNQLTTFEGCPQELETLNISYNQLTSFKGCPKRLTKLYIDNNQLSSLKGCPIKLVNWHGNPINL